MVDFQTEIWVIKCITHCAFIDSIKMDMLLDWCYKAEENDWRKMIAFESIGAIF